MKIFEYEHIHTVLGIVAFSPKSILIEVDSFTVPLHSPNSRQLGQGKGTVTGVWKTVGIPTGHVSP